MLTVSPSSAPWLATCLKRYHTLQVLRAYPGVRGSSPVLRFANVVHACLKALYDPNVAGLLPHTVNLETILRLAFLEGGYDDLQEREYEKARARKLLCAYLAQADVGEDEATVAVERSGVFPVKVDGEVLYSLTARLDRIVRLPSGLVAGIDYKIGAKLPPVDGILINLAVLKAAFPGAARYEFWIEALSDEGVERTVYRAEELKGAIHLLTARVRTYLASDTYPATPGEGCNFCPLREGCEETEGQAVDESELEF